MCQQSQKQKCCDYIYIYNEDMYKRLKKKQDKNEVQESILIADDMIFIYTGCPVSKATYTNS